MQTPKTCPVCGIEFTPSKNYPEKRFCSAKCGANGRRVENPNKTCLTCLKEFQPPIKHRDNVYCSLQCSAKAKQKRVMKICPGCGVEFMQRNVTSKYCSAKCGSDNRDHVGKDPSKWAVFTCKWCGKEFETWAYRNPTMCSAQCRSEYGARQPKLSARKPEMWVTKPCIVCGVEYTTTTHQIRLRGSTCCSRACVAIRQSQIKQGIGNPNFRGGTIKGRGSSWSAARKKALKRDGYKCRVCGKKISRFKHDYGVHHITPYRDFHGDHVKANDLSNLITLCRACHGKAEWDKIYVQRALF